MNNIKNDSRMEFSNVLEGSFFQLDDHYLLKIKPLYVKDYKLSILDVFSVPDLDYDYKEVNTIDIKTGESFYVKPDTKVVQAKDYKIQLYFI